MAQVQPRDLHPTSDIRFVIHELGKLTERIDGLKEASRDTGKLQIGAIVVALLLAAIGAWGLSTQIANVRTDLARAEDRSTARLDKLQDSVNEINERAARIEAVASAAAAKK